MLIHASYVSLYGSLTDSADTWDPLSVDWVEHDASTI